MRVRYRQLSFWSQVKAMTVAGLGGAVMLFLLFLVLHAAGVDLTGDRRDPSPGIAVVAYSMVSIFIAAAYALLQIAGLALLRLLPWRGPALEVADDIGLARLFE